MIGLKPLTIPLSISVLMLSEVAGTDNPISSEMLLSDFLPSSERSDRI